MITFLVSLVAIVNCQTAEQTECITEFVTNNLNVATDIAAECVDLVRNNECANNVLLINSPYSHQLLSCNRCALTCQEHASQPWNQFIRHVISTWMKVSPMHAPK